MPTLPTLEEQIAMAGIRYGRRHDISYRAGLVLQVLGAAVLAVLYPLDNPFYTIGIMVFDVGTFIAAVYLLVWMTWIKKIIAGLVAAGLALQVAGTFAPEEYAVTVIIAGIGLVCAGAAGLAGKEAYCFGYREGRLLMWGYPIVVLAVLLGIGGAVFNSLAFSALFLLILSLAGKKLRQPLLSSCTTDICEIKP
jgi:uncharacterized integral membrane protein